MHRESAFALEDTRMDRGGDGAAVGRPMSAAARWCVTRFHEA